MNGLTVVDVKIRQDSEGRYCLNDLHRASGGEERHKPGNWLQTQQTQGIIEELIKEQAVAGIPATEQKQPLKAYQGGNFQGTYACKELGKGGMFEFLPRYTQNDAGGMVRMPPKLRLVADSDHVNAG